MWADRTIRIPNPVMLALRSTDWVPTADGARCKPGQVILSGVAGRLLRGLYSQHAIDVNDPAIRRSGGRRAVNGLLTRLGAISSLEAIDADSLYELLSRLPQDDPDGQHAPGVYRTLIEAGVVAEDSLSRRQFFKNGRVWSRVRGESKYLPVSEVRYNANVTVPRVIEQHLKVAEFPRRKSTRLVRELFGVEPLATKDIEISLVDDGTEYAPSSEDANAAFRRALPYLYAIRLGKKLDEDNRERNLLHQAELRLCTRMRAVATLPSGETQTIEMDSQGDRLLLDRTLYMIDDFDREAPSLVRFWQGVAALVAEPPVLLPPGVQGRFEAGRSEALPPRLPGLIVALGQRRGRREGHVACVLHGPVVRPRVVALARGLFWLGLAVGPGPVAGRERRLPRRGPRRPPLRVRLGGAEEVRARRAVYEPLEHGLRLGAEEEHAVVPHVLRLVPLGTDHPDTVAAGGVDVARPQAEHLVGPGSREQLQPHGRRHRAGHVR